MEIRGNECRIEVHLRGTPIRMGMDQVYLFKVEGGQMLAFPMGEMRMIKRKRRLWNNYKKQIRLEDQNTRLPRWMEWFLQERKARLP